MLYTVAHKTWHIIKWIWVTLIIVFLIGLVANVLVVQVADLSKTTLISVLNWLLLPGLNRTLTLIIPALFIGITLWSFIITMVGDHIVGGKLLRQYLHFIVEANQGLNPKGFALQSQALISVNVPLDQIFIHLNAISDRPVYDAPSEQQKLLEELRHRPNLSDEECEELIQRLRVIWYSQVGQELLETGQKQNVAIEKVLQQLNATNPVAIILGSPGSGKSTVLRWLALHMARASLSRRYHLPNGLALSQIPILLRINDYAKQLSTNVNLSFKQFFTRHYALMNPNLPRRLLEELENGNCLLLLDGLDEVASDHLRRQIAEAIFTFVSDYTGDGKTAKRYNRFIITSRIVGYEAGTFAKYAHYTLLDLEDKQIEQFLNNWCPAVERYQAMASQGMKTLTIQQEKQTRLSGKDQRKRLLDALNNSPSIKRLAVNPLMLTILALIQRSGKTLPHRRIDLYQTVTRTLLDNWNQESGRKIIEEVELAEQLLSNLAFRLHTSDPIITERDVKIIARQTMADFYDLSPEQINDNTILQFITTLRSSSGLFVESGQGLFSFMHRTFQEYFAALYLLDKSHYTSEELKRFVVMQYRSAIWREPLLLAIAYKSGQRDRSERNQASELIQAILDKADEYDAILHRNLLFAATSVVDCSSRSIDKALQITIACQLFKLYGDFLGSGRYHQLQREIEDVTLLWLKGQPLPQDSDQISSWPPLLIVWYKALCNIDEPDALTQEGSTKLLVALASHLADCPQIVLDALIPPLLRLAGLQDLPCPSEINAKLSHTIVDCSTLNVETYAFLALHLLDKSGPAGWLHGYWLDWEQSEPEIIEVLTKHSHQLNYLLTPVSFYTSIFPPSSTIITLQKWHKLRQRYLVRFQVSLLRSATKVRYPHSYLFKKMVESEQSAPSLPWRRVWDIFLQKEMMKGNRATYQASLNLRLLLWQEDEQKQQEIAHELFESFSADERQQVLILDFLVDSYWQYLFSTLASYFEEMLAHQFSKMPSKFLKLSDILDKLKDLWLYLTAEKQFINIDNRLHEFIALCSYFMDFDRISTMNGIRIMDRVPYLRHFHQLLDTRELKNNREFLETISSYDIREVLFRAKKVLPKQIIDTNQFLLFLCGMIDQKMIKNRTLVLQAIYFLLRSFDSITINIEKKVRGSLQKSLKSMHELNKEECLFIIGILGLLENANAPKEAPSERQTDFKAFLTHFKAFLKEGVELTRHQVEEILLQFSDIGPISEEGRNQITSAEASMNEDVKKILLNLLPGKFTLVTEALPLILQNLDNNAEACLVAALLLKGVKTVPYNLRQETAQKIKKILDEEMFLCFPLGSPMYNYRIGEMENVLFETLKIVVE